MARKREKYEIYDQKIERAAQERKGEMHDEVNGRGKMRHPVH